MILIVDNYDSFTWNLVDLVRCQTETQVFRSDELAVEDVADLAPQGILISPGPGRPEACKTGLELVRRFQNSIPILGVCLGHQVIGSFFGARVGHNQIPMHGKTSAVQHQGKDLFEGLPNPTQVMRYHSLLLEKEAWPDELLITASTPEGEVMGLRHKELPLHGVQFHPESILSSDGKKMMANWLRLLD